MKRSLLLITSIFLLCVCATQAKNYESKRPAPDQRLFKSTAVENKIDQMRKALKSCLTGQLRFPGRNFFPGTAASG